MRIDCTACGRNRFTLDHDEDNSNVDCEDCGHQIGTLADLKQQVAETVLRNGSAKRQGNQPSVSRAFAPLHTANVAVEAPHLDMMGVIQLVRAIKREAIGITFHFLTADDVAVAIEKI